MFRRALITGALAVVWYWLMSAAPTTETVRINGGLISGAVSDGVRSYKGVPYAAPPLGDSRWKAPQPVAKWEGVRKADAFAPECMQTPYDGALAIFAMPMRPLSEDCLYLNVYTAATPHEKWPVMMWMHGGGLLRGGSSETPIFDGSALARKGVVVVTINYRLNVFGYLAHPELTAESPHHSSGNYGTLDQIEALKWIHRNIAAFGGDPGRVTIFGESAGSWSVNTLVASPLTKGLITGAIGESGGRFGPGTYLGEDRNGMSAEKRGLAFAKNAGADSIKALRAVPAEKLLTINAGGTNENVDGWVLPDEIRTIYAQRKQNHIPILIGENANEMTAVTSRESIPKTTEEYRKRIAQQYGDMAKDFDRAYPVMSEADIARAVLDNNRDTTFSVHIRRWARAHAVSGDPTYLYLFSHVPPHPDSAYLGAFHMSEIPYVFNNLNRIGVTYGGGKQENWRFTELDRRLSGQMSSYWVNFATKGDPNGKGLPKWRTYDLGNEPYLDLGDTIMMRDHLLKAQCDFLDAFQSRPARGTGN